MQKYDISLLIEYIANMDPIAIIPTLEKGLAVEELETIASQDPEAERRILHSRAMLCILRAFRLGR